EVARINEPALHVVAIVFPADALGFAPRRLENFVTLGDLFPLANRASPNFWRRAEGTADDGGGFSVVGRGKVRPPEARRDGFAAAQEPENAGVGGVEHRDRGIVSGVFGKKVFVAPSPREPARRSFAIGREVSGLAAGSGDDENIPADRGLITH